MTNLKYMWCTVCILNYLHFLVHLREQNSAYLRYANFFRKDNLILVPDKPQPIETIQVSYPNYLLNDYLTLAMSSYSL